MNYGFHTTDIHPQLPTQLPSASHPDPHIQVEFQKGKPICQDTETPFRTEQIQHLYQWIKMIHIKLNFRNR